MLHYSQGMKKSMRDPIKHSVSSNHHGLLLDGAAAVLQKKKKRLDWKDLIPVSALQLTSYVTFRKPNSLNAAI